MQVKDMTQGNPSKLLLTFALPLMAGNVFQQLYTFVDTMIVGRVLGVTALAAVGNTEWMTFMMFGLVTGMTQGFSVIMAQYFGAGTFPLLRKAMIHAIYFSIAGSILFVLAGQLFLRPVLLLIGVPDEALGLAQMYLSVLFYGIPISFAYNLSAAILRALGNSRVPLKAMIAASITNICLDLLFVGRLGLGIRGAALGTILAQLSATVFCIKELIKIDIIKPEKEEYCFDGRIGFLEIKIGLPMGIQNMITAIGGLMIQSVINRFGILFIAGYTAANKLYGMLETAASSYGYAISSYAGQNIGAGRIERIRKGYHSANRIGILTAYGMSIIMVLAGKFILSWFLAGDADTVERTIQTGYQFLIILAAFFPLLYVLYVTRSCIQGIGHSILPMISSMIQLVMRMGCAFILTAYIGQSGVFWGEITAWIGADILLIAGYRYYLKKLSFMIQE